MAAMDEGERVGAIAPEESHLLGNVFCSRTGTWPR